MGKYNKQAINATKVKLFLDGVTVADAIKCTITATPRTESYRQNGKKNTMLLGFDYDFKITRMRATAMLSRMLQKYKADGVTPEFTLQGVQDTAGSEYAANGGKSETVTAVGCVITSAIDLLQYDEDGAAVKDEISGTAQDVTSK
ncbi:MAG: phage tail tube protein [Oscillospiraceae bacterium]|jgi:hypothetical protein|nr:phage tail tube protein [Oscillospiraceae bacterium]